MSKTMARYRVLVSLTMLGCAVSANAQDHSSLQQRTPNTLTAAADVRSPRATVGDMAWFAGKWTGTGLGGVTEETWSAPADGAMMGMFRLVKDGKVVFYEFLTLVEEEGSLALKLKHFNPDLTGWEEKADSVKFRLLQIAPTMIQFGGLTFKRVGDHTLEVFLAIRTRDGSVREEAFKMMRATS
jgi:hypothetical protein